VQYLRTSVHYNLTRLPSGMPTNVPQKGVPGVELPNQARNLNPGQQNAEPGFFIEYQALANQMLD